MEGLSAAELYETITLVEGSLDRQFQFWITVSFAVFVSSYATRGNLSIRVRYVLTLLYALTVLGLILRVVAEIDRLGILHGALAAMDVGYQAPASILPTTLMITYLFGTVAAITSVFYYHKRRTSDA